MAKVPFEKFSGLLDEVRNLLSRSESVNGSLRQRLSKVESNLPKDSEGKFSQGAWQGLSQGQQAELQDQLTALREKLLGREATDFMSEKPAGNIAIASLLFLGLFGTLAILAFVVINWDDAVGGGDTGQLNRELAQARAAKETAESNLLAQQGQDTQAANQARDELQRLIRAERDAGNKLAAAESVPPSEATVLLMTAFLGALGGFLHYLGSLAKYIGNRDLVRSWIPYYLMVPVQGAALAPVVYLLLRVGVLSPGAVMESGTETLNLPAIYAFSALTGMFAKLAVEKLGEIFRALFRTRSKSKDSLEEDQAEKGDQSDKDE